MMFLEEGENSRVGGVRVRRACRRGRWENNIENLGLRLAGRRGRRATVTDVFLVGGGRAVRACRLGTLGYSCLARGTKYRIKRSPDRPGGGAKLQTQPRTGQGQKETLGETPKNAGKKRRRER